eukprot:9144385-Pyramimonas_sp.AAC.1
MLDLFDPEGVARLVGQAMGANRSDQVDTAHRLAAALDPAASSSQIQQRVATIMYDRLPQHDFDFNEALFPVWDALDDVERFDAFAECVEFVDSASGAAVPAAPTDDGA